MAGHSKWKNIQHRKGRQDAKRAKAFTKISKEIYASVRSGGADSTTNLKLRLALNKAKEVNMPNDNIERTIKKATGDVEGLQYEEIVYEGYGPKGVAVMVEVLTDNRNRSAADIRHIFNKNNGNLGESGCVSYLFQRKGLLIINKDEVPMSEDDLMLETIDTVAEDFISEDQQYEIYTDPQDFETVKQGLEEKNIPFHSSEVTMIPSTTVELSGDDLSQMMTLIDALEEHDDVQNVFANVELNDEQLAEWS